VYIERCWGYRDTGTCTGGDAATDAVLDSEQDQSCPWVGLTCALGPSFSTYSGLVGGSVAEWLACWTQAQKGLGSNRSRDAVG